MTKKRTQVRDCVGCGRPRSTIMMDYPRRTGPWCATCYQIERDRIKKNLDTWSDEGMREVR